jgi:predicted O-linked N-acetylglucosamine transferase (SPINDLY family)
VAPIQICWLGYVNTTGINQMDYLITDPYLIKDNEKILYSEKIISLPKIWNSHEKLDEKLKIKIPCETNNFITFGSFNSFRKISLNVINVWSEILLKSDSKLILKSSMNNSKELRDRLLNKFPSSLLKENKIILIEGQRDKIDHLNMYHKIDIGLDTFPYNGVTTSFEAIWMGVPILTLRGYNFTSRCGESININCNLQEFIAMDKKDYVKKAVNLCKDIEKIKNLKKNLREMAIKSSLFDSKGFADSFYEKLKDLWTNYKK